MAEVMTSESIIEAFWLLKGFWTKPRFAFKTENGQWSDVDVLAYHPEDKHLVVAESKVRGDKWDVFAFTAEMRESCGDILRYDGGEYFSFLDRLPTICRDGTVFSEENFSEMVRRLTVQLVSNYFIGEDLRPTETEVVRKDVERRVRGDFEIDVRLDSTLEIICEIVWETSDDSQGRRYGHPILDIARELNRYIYPCIRYAGNAKSKSAIEREIARLLKEMLHRWPDESPD